MKREGGSSRRDAPAKSIESVGGKMEAFCFAFGEFGAHVICDLPDEKSALATSMAVNQTGVMSARFVVLVSPETVDAASKIGAAFRAPGS